MHEAAGDRAGAHQRHGAAIPIGLNPGFTTYFPDGFVVWADDLCTGRSELDRDAVQSFGENMWNHDCVYSVRRDFVRAIDPTVVVMPGNDTSHPAVIGLGVADILPCAERLMDWKGPDHTEAQGHRVAEFLAHHTPG